VEDGKPVTWTYEAGKGLTVLSVSSPPAVMGGLILSYALRDTTDGDPDLVLRLRDALLADPVDRRLRERPANGANTIKPQISPGT